MVEADNVFPQYINISLVFTRNETYDSTSGILPVIFSLTNQANAINLYPDISVNISRHGSQGNDTHVHAELFLDNPYQEHASSLGMITINGDNVYLYTVVPDMIGYEGIFHLGYSISLMTLVSNNDTRGFSTALDTPLSYGSLGFTLKKGNGNSLADLVAGTANTSCADVPFLWPLSVVNVLNEGCKTHSPRSPGVTCAYLANNTLGVVADYDEDEPFVNMTTTGFGCAPTIDAAAAAVVESKIWNATCGHPGNITCPANFTGGPHSNLAPVAVPGLAVAMAVVMGAAAGAVLL